ncbi:MRG-domain-containing protein [Plectosphaerella cucumerina]|uniref:Chromatin modification-related protein EAF3 n=1 Tax=Plectosphaerella cucumerina TaxID=40658 RepID=A0A8K0X6W9_9PEZI|nr:MRG-domain-containing protein [Plectosphaerella cucumerina]
MAPARATAPQPFDKDERVLCFHHDMLYEAKILDVQAAADGDGFQYKIHYKGWKNTWDDWVAVDRIRKFTEQNKELAAQLQSQMRNLQKSSSKLPKKGPRANGTESARGSEERTSGLFSVGRGPRRARDYDLEQEDGFHTRPSIKLPIPDHIKAVLVDDWENVTKNNQLVPLPHPHPVDEIINDYLAYERPSRDPESPHLDILIESMAGLKEYFDKALGRILLYRFERLQYHEIRKVWEKAGENDPHTSVCDTYGAEHLCRLLVSLPELVAQTTMDQQSVSRLREELSKFTVWLGKNAKNYFVSEYETPAQEYIDRARSS